LRLYSERLVSNFAAFTCNSYRCYIEVGPKTFFRALSSGGVGGVDDDFPSPPCSGGGVSGSAGRSSAGASAPILGGGGGGKASTAPDAHPCRKPGCTVLGCTDRKHAAAKGGDNRIGDTAGNGPATNPGAGASAGAGAAVLQLEMAAALTRAVNAGDPHAVGLYTLHPVYPYLEPEM
jgi:hypothetical protein